MKKSNSQRGADFKTLLWIASVCKGQLSLMVSVIVLGGFLACFATVIAIISKWILDSAQQGDSRRFIIFCTMLIVIAALQVLVGILSRYLTEKLHARLDIAFKKKVFGTIVSKSYSDIKNYHSGELVNRLTADVSVITDAATNLPVTVASTAVRIVCAFGALVLLQPYFAFLFLAGGFIIYVITAMLRKRVKGLHKRMQKKEGKVRSFWQEISENLLVIKSFGGEEMTVEKSRALMSDHYVVRMKKALLGAFSAGASQTVMRAGYIFALCYCAYKLLLRQMSFGTLTAITALVNQVQTPFSSLSGVMPRYYAALSSAERLLELEELSNEKESGDVGDIGYDKFTKISAENLVFSYDKNKIIDGLCFEIEKGDFVSVMGRSGIGKSTVFKLLLAIYETGGSIDFVFDGKRVAACPATRSLFAYVPQGNLLFSGTIRENLLFLTGERSEEEIAFALKVACADEFIGSLPDGLETQMGENGVGISEGQAQRLAVARAILSSRPILLFDEATSALDEQTEKQMLDNIKSLTDKTCIMVTHKNAALEICNKNIVLK